MRRSSSHLHRNYDNEAPGMPLLLRIQSTLTFSPNPVNDVVVHPNQGELISCDQAGRIKQWDLSENICTHELVRTVLSSFRGPFRWGKGCGGNKHRSLSSRMLPAIERAARDGGRGNPVGCPGTTLVSFATPERLPASAVPDAHPVAL